jgi:uncharacterized protein
MGYKDTGCAVPGRRRALGAVRELARGRPSLCTVDRTSDETASKVQTASDVGEADRARGVERQACLEEVVPETDRSTLKRKRERGSHDRETIYSILDEGLVCHVGFSDGRSVYVVPTTYGRVEDHLYLHGAAANRTLGEVSSEAPVCVTVTLLDGLVFSRSAFHHSMNYRSVMIFGTATKVEDPDEKTRALLAIVDHMAPGRSRDSRPPSPIELKATSVVRVELSEASAKTRTGGPVEEPEDLALRVWGGELPLETIAADPVPDELLPSGTEVPSYIAEYKANRRSAGDSKR